MPKQRKTRKAKVRSSERKQQSEGFVIDERLLKVKMPKRVVVATETNKKYFRADLTKTLILTMLVLALEFAIWNYLSRH